MMPNVDERVVEDFGREWQHFDQAALSSEELEALFDAYFAVFPWDRLPEGARGFDLGCGTGRWARLVAPRVGVLHCIDPSAALEVARRNLEGALNCRFHRCGVDALPFDDGSMDFGYSLGVLHHLPDTAAAIRACAAKLKPGAPLLLYLYYAFENRPLWFRLVWRVTDLLRRLLSRSPYPVKFVVSQAIAACVYWPLARTARLLGSRGRNVANLPLSAYRDRSFYTMRTDALDRFGTRLERRFTRRHIETMMSAAGLVDVLFHDDLPYWCVVGIKT